MMNLKALIRKIIYWRESGKRRVTLLAVCPNSSAVLEAAVRCASLHNTPMLFAATLNQVDRDGGYTTWTPADFVYQMCTFAAKYSWSGPLYPCLDHGGPWLKDIHTTENMSYDQTMQEVKQSLTACIEAGYQLLHIDPTVDRRLPANQPVPVERVAARTIELISHAEDERTRYDLAPIAYEVGTEEVHGGLVDFSKFQAFLANLRSSMTSLKLMDAWPAFFVAQVGTDLHTTTFNPAAANRIYTVVAPTGALAKGHYTDWVDGPEQYPQCGMGGANVGPEFTTAEVHALQTLCENETELLQGQPQLTPSNFLETLEQAVIVSQRWKKWLLPNEKNKDFASLELKRQAWLIETGARYVWTDSEVKAARKKLYENLSLVMTDPQSYVVEHIVAVMEKYIRAFNLHDLLAKLEEND
jgi:tagatose-1,6-bisphosphate aldolase non-catalytic subunit AgaZ/GatZ